MSSIDGVIWKPLVFAAIGSILTLASSALISRMKRNEKLSQLRMQIGSDEYEVVENILSRSTSVPSLAATANDDDDSLIKEQLARNYAFFGDDGMENIRKVFVVVVGLGGVGSHAAVHLVRSGISNIRLVDFDQVTLSSLNRHACAVRSDVGTPKVEAMKKYFAKIFPSARVDARNKLFSAELADDLILDGNPDFVIDCIDNLDTKIQLLKYCHDKGIKVISSMGSACKADPSRIQIADISATSEDRMARTVRYKLRKVGIESGITVVYSTERTEVSIMPLQEEACGNPDEFATLPNFRVRILPVLGAIPAIFGAALASFVLCSLGNHKLDPIPIKLRNSFYQRLYKELVQIYKDKHDELRITLADTGYLADEVWHGRSALSSRVDLLTLTKWNPNLPLTIDNGVLMTREEAQNHAKLKRDEFSEYYGIQTVKQIERKLEEMKNEV